MKNLRIVAFLALALLLPGMARAEENVLPAAESAALDAAIKPFLDSLSGASPGSALLELFETSTAGGLRPDQAAEVSRKIDEAINRYGAGGRCELFDQRLLSPLLVQRRYMCQHRTSLSHWRFVFLRLPDGWAISKFNFTTNVDELFELRAESGEGDESG